MRWTVLSRLGAGRDPDCVNTCTYQNSQHASKSPQLEHSSTKVRRESRASEDRNRGVFEISAPRITWRQEAPRVRRKEHLTIENAMLRRRSLSAFSHTQDPQRNRGLAITSLNFVLVEAA